MILLKIIGKILLVPVWIVVVIAWLLVKVVVAVYSFARGVTALGFIALIVGTVICYHDWQQVSLLIIADVFLIAILFAGTVTEELLGILRTKIENEILVL